MCVYIGLAPSYLPTVAVGCGGSPAAPTALARPQDKRARDHVEDSTLQAVTDAHGADAHGVGATSAQPHGLG